MLVSPGDFIFGDIDGVRVIPKAVKIGVRMQGRVAGSDDGARAAFGRGEDPVEGFKGHRRR